MELPTHIEHRQVRPLWIAHLKDGTTITEETAEWSGLDQKEIQSIQLKLLNGKFITFSKKNRNVAFFQFKQAEELMMGGNPVALGIVIGMVENKEGDCVFAYVSFKDGNITIDFDNVLNPKNPFMKLNLDYYGINLSEL